MLYAGKNIADKIDLNKYVTGFVYTFLTCAFDTLLTSFLLIYQSESLEKRELFERTILFFSKTFHGILNKSVTYPEAKEDILSTFFFSGGRFEPGRFQMIGDVMESVLKSQILTVMDEDENYLQLHYDQKLTCHSDVCSIRDPTVTHCATNSIPFHAELVNKSSISSMVNEYFELRRRHFRCSTSNALMEEQLIIKKLPRVLYIALCGDKINFDIDRQIILNNVAYKLVVVIYSGCGHFMSRMMVNNYAIEYDGMVANGSFRIVDPVNAFYGQITDLTGTRREAFQILYKREDESC